MVKKTNMARLDQIDKEDTDMMVEYNETPVSKRMGVAKGKPVKSEGFNYTKWQRDYFGRKTKEDLDAEMDAYFESHPYKGDPAKVI